MTAQRRTKWLVIGVLAGVALGWALPTLVGPAISAYGLTLRESPRLSDAILGAGSLGVYIAQAPSLYLALHTADPAWPEAPVNAISWALIGALIAAFVLAIGDARRKRTAHRRLLAGALGGLLIGWLLPALAGVLGDCFAHCWMHEGLLGDMALAGGTALRVLGIPAEAPWRLLWGAAPGAMPPLAAIPVSAAIWAVIGVGVAALPLLSGRRVGVGGEADVGGTEAEEA